MNPLTWLTITSSIALSTSLITTTTHWLMTWMCLEINTLSMTPLISKPNHPRATEAATKYYLTQTLASTTLMFAATMNALNTSNWETHLTTEPLAITMITMALLMKMAAAPFHFWLPEVSQGTSTMTTLTILTWQKIAPLTIMLTINQKINITPLLMSAALSILIGGLGGLNQPQLQKLMAFSSITHTGWTITTLTMAPNISILTFLIYTMTTIPMFLLISLTSTTTIKNLSTTWTTSPHLTMPTTMIMLSLAGLPPLTGFMPKWLILNNLISLNMFMEATTLAMTSLLGLYLYMRLAYMASMTALPHTTLTTLKWRPMNKKQTTPTALFTTLSMLLLPALPNM
nr:NADH dehydrogenase subunit 2 [Calamaria septentrionalis]UOD77167.1 NADH dehydrogenase subunit 2 [Calamaria septentrionalis]